jgi:hypothetical protein
VAETLVISEFAILHLFDLIYYLSTLIPGLPRRGNTAIFNTTGGHYIPYTMTDNSLLSAQTPTVE